MPHRVDHGVLEQVLHAHELTLAGPMDLPLQLLGGDLGEVPSMDAVALSCTEIRAMRGKR